MSKTKTITEAAISVVPDAPSLASIAPSLDIALWNGLFVHKDTPADVREKIIASAQKTMASDRPCLFARRIWTS